MNVATNGDLATMRHIHPDEGRGVCAFEKFIGLEHDLDTEIRVMISTLLDKDSELEAGIFSFAKKGPIDDESNQWIWQCPHETRSLLFHPINGDLCKQTTMGPL